MTRYRSPRIAPRPLGTSAFFDYVLAATHDQARRARASRALQERRLAESRSTSAERRWEGEGGSMQCTPGGQR